MARQYLVAAILYQLEDESLASAKVGLQQSRILVLSIDAVLEGASYEELEKVVISDDKEKFFQFGAQLPPQKKEEQMVFLRKNIDVFAQSAYEAPGVDPNLICHHLNVNLVVITKKKPPWRSSKKHSEAVKEELLKLNQARAIKEVFYLEWLANTVMVKKKNEKWRVCVDFTDLNKACPRSLPYAYCLGQTSWWMRLQAILG